MFNCKSFLYNPKKKCKKKSLTKLIIKDQPTVLTPSDIAENYEVVEPPDIKEKKEPREEKSISYILLRELSKKDDDEEKQPKYEGITYQQLVLKCTKL